MHPTGEVVEKGKAQPREIELGFTDGQRVEVRDGLKEGDEVIVKGAYALPAGTPVVPEAPPAEEKPEDAGAKAERGP